MPAVLAPVRYEPIRAVRVLSQQGALPQLFRIPEDITQTFQVGVPIKMVAGYAQEWVGTNVEIIYGFSAERTHSYPVAGGGVTQGLPPILPATVDLTDPAAGPPPNQPNAVTIPMGAALRDGAIGVLGANASTVFSAALLLGQVFTAALVIPGTGYRLIKDGTSGFWYIDSGNTAGNNAVASILGVDPSCPNTATGGCRVFFQILAASRAF